MNMGWVKIIGAALFELVWITGLKYAETPLEWTVSLSSIIGSTYCLLTAGNTLPVGTAYSVFVGLSAVGTVAIECFGFHVVPSGLQLFFICLLMAGVIGLKFINEEKTAVVVVDDEDEAVLEHEPVKEGV